MSRTTVTYNLSPWHRYLVFYTSEHEGKPSQGYEEIDILNMASNKVSMDDLMTALRTKLIGETNIHVTGIHYLGVKSSSEG